MEKKKRYEILLSAAMSCLAICVFWATSVHSQPSILNDHLGYVADELLVKPKQGVAKQKIHEILTGFGAATTGEIPQIRVKRIKVPAKAMEKVQEALAKNPHFQFVEKNFIAKAGMVPNDPYYGNQTYLGNIMAPAGWDISTGSRAAPIALIDSGVDPIHPDLKDKLVSGYNFLSNNTDTHDVLGHGTAVAGCAAASANNLTGIASVAWQNPIMPLVVLNSSDSATYSDIASAITYAADRGVRVINISIGGSSSSSTLQNAVNYAWNKGCIIFACAMNESTSTPYYPAACDNVAAVSATTSTDLRASFSNYGNWVDLSAPGASIYTTKNGGGYSTWYGTSFSSPITAGLAALILSIDPSLTNSQVVETLEQNADDLGTAGYDIYFGHGRINVYQSLLAVTSQMPQPDQSAPSVSITSPEDGSTVSSTITINVSAVDNVSVEEVSLFLDGNEYASDATAPYAFSLDTTQYTSGSHTLKAVAYDSSGNRGESGLTTIYVDNIDIDNPPAVQITAPAESSTFYVGIPVNFSGGAADPEDGDLTAGLAWNSNIDGLVGQGGSFSSKLSTGNHTITASVTDSAGNFASQSINIVVVENAPIPSQVSVSDVSYYTVGGKYNDKHLYVTVGIKDETHSAVPGASVSIVLLCNSGGCGSWSYTGNTDDKGEAVFFLKSAPSGCYTTNVTDVAASGSTWDNTTPANELCK